MCDLFVPRFEKLVRFFFKNLAFPLLINTEIAIFQTIFMPIRKKGKHRRRADNSAARRRRKNSKRGKAKNR